ncbi:MAG: response regulator transcription factor [Planctomycetota bacterium]|nr:response regulator transcription factor [Planctomycetota bacterium]
MRVLIVDDDPDFRIFTTHALEGAGIEYACAEDGLEGLRLLKESPRGSFDLILLDVVMPGASGWDLLLELREKGNEIPVIFVTGREKVEERVRGLRLGADDYLVKPVAFEELIARIEAVLRRRNELANIEFGDLTLDLARRKADRAGVPVDLSPREYDLLLALARGGGETVSRADLLREVWGLPFDPGTNVLDVHIGRVRRKTDRLGRPLIRTVRGEGYQLVRHVSPE